MGAHSHSALCSFKISASDLRSFFQNSFEGTFALLYSFALWVIDALSLLLRSSDYSTTTLAPAPTSVFTLQIQFFIKNSPFLKNFATLEAWPYNFFNFLLHFTSTSKLGLEKPKYHGVYLMQHESNQISKTTRAYRTPKIRLLPLSLSLLQIYHGTRRTFDYFWEFSTSRSWLSLTPNSSITVWERE